MEPTPTDPVAELRESLDACIAAELDAAQSQERTPRWQAFSQLANRHQAPAFGLLVERIRKHGATPTPADLALAELLCTKALSLEPSDPEVVTILAARYIDRGLHQQAVALLQDLRAQEVTLPVIDRLLGQAAWRAGNSDVAAAAFYRIAAEPHRHDWESLKLAAEYFRFEGSRPSLRMLLFRMTEMRDDDPDVCYWRGEWHAGDNDGPEAAKWFERAEQLAEPRSQLYWQIWRARFEFQHPEDMEKYKAATAGIFAVSPSESLGPLAELVAKHPDFWEARYFLGTCHRRMGELAKAAECFRSVVACLDFPNAWLELGGVLGELGQPKAALEASTKADQLFEGKNHVAVLNMAAARLELGDLAAAGELVARARSLKPASKAVGRLEAELESRRNRKPGFFGRLFGRRQ